jgi:hypothetical protein
MGMTDFGVTSGGHPYSYSTSAWLGTVHLSKLKATGGTVTTMTFQLNVVVTFQGASGNFSYWVQNVVGIDTSTETVRFLNNIWNFSSSTGGLSASELSGNGTVNSMSGVGTWYACLDGVVGNGNAYRMTFPTTIQAKVTTGFYNGLPNVDFLYNDGFGWISYDNVSFLHGANWKDLGYVVDGFQYAAIAPGLYTDGEWDFSGSGSGFKDVLSDLTMGLEYWNGHNFQTPQNVWNFGGNTAESMGNVVPRLETDGSTGNLTVRETNGTGGTLGPLFGSSQVATITAYVPGYPEGTIHLGTGNRSYAGGRGVFTVTPGNYPISLWQGSNEIGITGWANVSGGQSLYLELPIINAAYRVSFHAIGLPTGTPWGVAFGGGPTAPANYTTGDWLNFTAVNDSYPFEIQPVPGFTTPSYRSQVTVSGFDQILTIRWSPFEFRVTFAPTGLPEGTPWTVTVEGTTPARGVGSNALVVQLPNGTWSYSITTVVWLAASPAADNITVAGVEVLQPLSFGAAPSYIAGTLSPAGANLSVDGTPVLSITGDGSFRVAVPAGSHQLNASANGFVPAFWNVTTTAGNTTVRSLTIDAVAPPAGSKDGAGAAGTDWSIAYVGVAAVGVVAALVLALALRGRPPARAR